VKAAPACTRARSWTVVRWIAAAAVLTGLGVAAARNLEELRDVDLEVRPGWLAAALPLTAFASVALPRAWHRTVLALGGRLAVAAGVRIWWQSQAARFVVTMVGTAAGRAAMAAREGVRLQVAAAAQVLELLLLIGWSVLLGALPDSGAPVPAGLRAALLVGAVAGLAALPWSAQRALGLVHRYRPQVEATTVDHAGLVAATAAYGLNAVLRSGAFVLVAAGLLPVGGDDVLLLVAAWNLAAVAGIIGITPAGIGVREGVMIALLQDRFGLGGAAALAAAWRAWELAFEVASVAAVTALGRRQRSGAAGAQSSTT
jgi:glycosyltransferase 2 family protein